MSAGTYIEGACVHLHDVNGFPASFPVDELADLARRANESDRARARWSDRHGTRWFDRDALNGALDLLPVCTYSDAYAACETPTVFDPADTRPKCPNHKEASR
jgi:hypothetical protein